MDTQNLVVAQLGARILNEKEIELSLPTYPKLLEQIETIRSNAEHTEKKAVGEGEKKSAFTRRQVTNNFAILGPRGAGKTSILKTLYDHLDEENNSGDNDKKLRSILLPPIVPENMSSAATLMSTLLGLLKEPVLQYDARQEKRKCHQDCCTAGKSELTKKYNKLVEDYIRIQEPYQNVTVEHYSSDWDYLQRMIDVYQAGNQFSERFHDVIDQLLENEDNALLFVFIDDIDLSASRCTDVVKTLLAYVAHPRIVTILAGDLDTFDEALTLDFLRQEKLPDSNATELSFLPYSDINGTERSLLDRKKALAYEYLKKIMPPNYRHYVTQWNIKMRGDFQPIRYTEKGEKCNIKLSELLEKVGISNPLLRRYFWSKSGNQNSGGSVAYHVFDSTARGLANAYLAVEQILYAYKLQKKEPSTDSKYQIIKSSLETIVASNPRLSQYRDLILGEFLQFGVDAGITSVRFDNYVSWAKSKIAVSFDEFKKGGKKETKHIIHELEAFSVFLYLDFSVRLLERADILQSEAYLSAKKLALFLLCTNGYISERREVLPDAFREMVRSLADETEKREKIYRIKDVSLISLFRFDFHLALQYFTYLDLSGIASREMGERVNIGYVRQNRELHDINNFLELLEQHYAGKETSPDYISMGSILENHKEMAQLIENHLQENKKAMFVAALYSDYFSEEFAFYKNYVSIARIDRGTTMMRLKNEFSHKYLDGQETKWTHRVDELSGRNSADAFPMHNLYAEDIFSRFSDDLGRPETINTTQVDLKDRCFGESVKQDLETRIKIIAAVDKNGLWKEDASTRVFEYVKQQLKKAEEALLKQEDYSMVIDVTGAYLEFKRSFYGLYTGVSYTLADQCRGLMKTMFDGCEEINGRQLTVIPDYICMRIVLERLISSTAWYGRPQARAVLAALNGAKAVFRKSVYPREELVDQLAFNHSTWEGYLFWLQCYARYQFAMQEKTHELVEAVHEKLNTIKKSQDAYYKSCVESYEEKLREGTNMSLEELRQGLNLF